MNQPNWVDNVLGVAGALGFLLAFFLAIVEYRRYRLPLLLFVHCYYVQYSDNQESAVLFHLSFVNSASAGKIVNKTTYSRAIYHNAGYSRQPDITWEEPKNQYDIFQDIVTYELPNNHSPMPAERILQYPLDIPPHQSRTRWLLLIAKVHKESLSTLPIQFQALDVEKKIIAERKVLIPKENLMKPGIYYTDESLYFSL